MNQNYTEEKNMSYTNINNVEYYDNVTYDGSDLESDLYLPDLEKYSYSAYNDNDEFTYDAELVPFNDTHDCIRLLDNSEVQICLDI